jgi:hypothetical protein
MDLPELWAIFGPGVAGAVFGAGWWFWIDAVVCGSVTVSVVHYLPGHPPFSLIFSLSLNFNIQLHVFLFRLIDFLGLRNCRHICIYCFSDV